MGAGTADRWLSRANSSPIAMANSEAVVIVSLVARPLIPPCWVLAHARMPTEMITVAINSSTIVKPFCETSLVRIAYPDLCLKFLVMIAILGVGG